VQLWNAPAALARDLHALLAAELLLPAPAQLDLQAEEEFTRAAAQLRSAWAEEGVDACAAVTRARAAKIFNGNKLRADTLDKLWSALADFCADTRLEAPAHERLAYLTPAELRARANTGRENSVPTSPLFDAIEHFLRAQEHATQQRAQRRANLLHAIRDYAATRIADLKRARNLIGFDDLIRGLHDALRGSSGAALAAILRTRYPAALVDEFQDTDPRQWDIFRRIYVDVPEDAAATALFLIGDPKQAIYRFRGGDVQTYHAAGAHVQSRHALTANFRSRPRVLAAVAALFARGGEFPFADATTLFVQVDAGGLVADRDFDHAGRIVPGLHLWQLPLRDGETTRPSAGKPEAQIKLGAARSLAAAASAARIRDLLADRSATLRSGERERRVRPADIAVIVNTHREAQSVQLALSQLGVASVTAGRSSLYASREAAEILRVLEGVHARGDEGRMRAALATELLGQDAAAIDALSRDEDMHRAWLDAFQSWQQRWQRLGPLPMLGDRIAAAAPRLLALGDGERRLGNYLQLAEQLQEARADTLGASGLLDWLAHRIADADDRDETQQLRLESDAERVQILTLHKAKGLEFALVFLPFAALPPASPPAQGLALVHYHDGSRRVQRARIRGLDDAGYELARAAAQRETRAEQLRLLYVGLTRARHALWLAHGAVNDVERTALAWLLHRDAEGNVGAVGDAAVRTALSELADANRDAIVFEAWPSLAATRISLDIETEAAAPPLQIARRILRQDWWVHSFSQLAREDSLFAAPLADERGADDEGPALVRAPSPFSGARFGNALHTALEHVDFALWRDSRADQLVPGQGELLRHALLQHGYVGDEVAQGERVLATLVRNTLNAPLPEGVRLADLPAASRRNELEFHFALGTASVPGLLDLLHRHDLLIERNGFGARDRLQGLMTGFIDLVYTHAGRVYLLDYKSNLLTDYAPATLQQAMRTNEYDLQYLIYTLALHRWLRFRSAGYDYERDFGGVRYLFCRGLDSTPRPSESQHGVFAARPSRALIDELDALFAAPPGNVA
jgi:exodeoxyribonuclease V beta subunit